MGQVTESERLLTAILSELRTIRGLLEPPRVTIQATDPQEPSLRRLSLKYEIPPWVESGPLIPLDPPTTA